MGKNDSQDYLGLLMLAIEASVEAGALVMGYRTSGNNKFRLKRDFTPVTLADKKASELIIGRLASSGLNVVSEEVPAPEYKVRNQWKAFWITDPIDGTKEFIRGGNDFSINIGLVKDQETFLGVIYAPCTGELYYGCKPAGAFKQIVIEHTVFEKDILNEKFRIFPKSPLNNNLVVVVSRYHKDFKTVRLLRKLEERFEKITFVSKGSSLKFCMIAEGKADFFPRFMELKEWDTAAGQAIAEAAGCFVSQINGAGKVLYNKKKLLTPAHFVGQSEKLVDEVVSFCNTGKWPM